jgi:hypothetical protein
MTYSAVAVTAGTEQSAATAATVETGLTHKIPDTPRGTQPLSKQHSC